MEATEDRGRRTSPHGFTVLELLIVMLVVVLMAGVAAPAISSAQNRMGLNNATNGVVFLSSRARAHAANRGAIALLEIDPNTDQGWVRFGNDTVVGGFVDFREDFGSGIDVSDDEGLLTICYSPRGYAQPGCADVPRLPVYIVFTRGGHSDSVRIEALGRVEVPE
jgi:prepilin-type N-terminal cleavage/methylation domain-containing protein